MDGSENRPITEGRRASHSVEELLPLVYEELRRLTSGELARERPGQTLQPTALVHEAWLRLTRSKTLAWEGRTHFFAASAKAIRRILVENARRKQCIKRGGGCERVDADPLDLPGPVSGL